MTIKQQTLEDTDALRTIIDDYIQQNLNVAIPAVIQGLNYKDNSLETLDVQPAINKLITDQESLDKSYLSMPIICKVPYCLPLSQKLGLSIRIPIQKGDECLLIFSHRSIDNWQYNGGLQNPVEDTVPRKHHLTDAIAIIGIATEALPINNYKDDAIEISNQARNTFISLSNDNINIEKNNSVVNITDGSISLSKGSSNILIEDSKITFTAQEIIYNGAVEYNNNVKYNSEITSNQGVTLTDHIHNDPQGGITGPPENT